MGLESKKLCRRVINAVSKLVMAWCELRRIQVPAQDRLHDGGSGVDQAYKAEVGVPSYGLCA